MSEPVVVTWKMDVMCVLVLLESIVDRCGNGIRLSVVLTLACLVGGGGQFLNRTLSVTPTEMNYAVAGTTLSRCQATSFSKVNSLVS